MGAKTLPRTVEHAMPEASSPSPEATNLSVQYREDSGATHDESFEMVHAPTQLLDLVFLLDCTGSMGSYIAAAKDNVERISQALANAQGYDLRLGLVGYRDHPPQDNSYVTRSFPFASSVSQMRANLTQLSAAGGGDGPEAVEAGLLASLEMDWRERATKIVILIADAPPHGLGERGDGFPYGAPTGVDPLVVLDDLSAKGICVYSVGCEPALSNYRFAKAFFVAVAERTNGQAVALSSASSLADVILGASIEECELERLTTEVERQVRSLQLAEPGLAETEIEARVCADLQARGAVTRQMQCCKLSSANSDVVCRAASLSEAKKSLAAAPAAPPPYRSLESSDLATIGVPLAVRLPCYRGLGHPEADDGDVLETTEDMPVYRSFDAPDGADLETTEDTPVYRSLAFHEEILDYEEMPTHRSLRAPLAPVPAGAVESMGKRQRDLVTVTEGVISKEQVARLFSRGKKRGLWGRAP
mmetsp:Transcript_37385/g.74715  ORF Transcript_37385/g.74715 Transcript_37385/m.74715 type:complete len:475 (-) Transcript_37385:369-1793(-)